MAETSVSPQVANWLYNVVEAQYIHKKLVYTHVHQFLQVHYKRGLDFKIKTKVHTSSTTGHSQVLINLSANIPIKEVSIPVEIWVPLNYPMADHSKQFMELNGVPLVYVVPDHQRGLYLKINNHVDTQGRFYHPYLHDWYTGCTERNLQQFNLLSLVQLMHGQFMSSSPIRETDVTERMGNLDIRERVGETTGSLSVQSTGPQLPPKIRDGPDYRLPPKIQDGPDDRLPPKIKDGPSPSIPLKYQAPLPLPQDAINPPQQNKHPIPPYENVSYQGQKSPPFQAQKSPPYHLQQPSPYHAERPPHAPIYQSSQASISQQPTSSQQPESLMDSDIPQATQGTTFHRELLQILSDNINVFLQNDVHNQLLPQLNRNEAKVGAFKTQISSHLEKAKANSSNIAEHQNQLRKQLGSLEALNEQLRKLDALNADYFDRVFTSEHNSMHLDDIVIPDSPLVKQIYDAVSEIKAIKDTISLIGGSFGEKEIINDNRLDGCVKMVRNLGRELFWLELTKIEALKKVKQ